MSVKWEQSVAVAISYINSTFPVFFGFSNVLQFVIKLAPIAWQTVQVKEGYLFDILMLQHVSDLKNTVGKGIYCTLCHFIVRYAAW